MRLSNFLVMFSACALFAACANDETPDGNNLPQGNGEQAFIAVRLAAPNAMTRAFQDGKNEENAVTTARFYFFNNEGTAVTVDNSVNYKDVTTTFSDATSPADESGNVEEISNAVLVLENATVWPEKMVVVLNPPTELNASKSLSDLRAAADDYASEESGKFVMSNAVYATSSGTQVDAVDLAGYITNNKDAAEGNPVTVYVERVLARVDVACTSNLETDKTDGTGTQQSEINGYSGSNGTNEIQAVIKGWTLANRNSQSHLLKSLSAWNNSTTFTAGNGSWAFANWNDATNHRSYWAYTDDVTATKLPNDSYAKILENNSTFVATDYCQENTSDGAATELVAIAELQVDGQKTDIAKYAGQYWTVANLLKQFAGQILAGKSTTKPTLATPPLLLHFPPLPSSCVRATVLRPAA